MDYKNITVNFEDLNNIDIPYNEKIILGVILDGIKYEFLCNFLNDSDKIIVCGSTEIIQNQEIDRIMPFFDKENWDFEDSTIFYNDPTQQVPNEIIFPWCIGTDNEWYLEKISLILEAIFVKIGINNDKILFYGNSAGGFTSLMLSTLIKDSISLAEFPQFNILNLCNFKKNNIKCSFYKDIIKYCFSNINYKSFQDIFSYRCNIVDLIKKENYIPNAYILVDCFNHDEYQNQVSPFLKSLNELPFNVESNKIKFIFKGMSKDHSYLDYEEFIPILRSIKSLMDYEKNINKIFIYNNYFNDTIGSEFIKFNENIDYLFDNSENCIKLNVNSYSLYRLHIYLSGDFILKFKVKVSNPSLFFVRLIGNDVYKEHNISELGGLSNRWEEITITRTNGVVMYCIKNEIIEFIPEDVRFDFGLRNNIAFIKYLQIFKE